MSHHSHRSKAKKGMLNPTALLSIQASESTPHDDFDVFYNITTNDLNSQE